MSSLLFLGDVMLGRKTPNKIDGEFLSKEVLSLFENSEIIVANFEAPISALPEQKGFFVDKKMLELCSKITAFSLANNHIFDQGSKGFEETIQEFDQVKKGYFGTLKNPSYRFISDNKEFRIFGAIDKNLIKNKNKQVIDLFENNIVLLENYDFLSDKIEKKDGVVNILYAHAGDEFIPILSPRLKKIAEKYSKFGFDYIFFNHSHITGSELTLKDTKVYYSLGDFIFDGESYKRLRNYCIKINLDQPTISGKIFLKSKKERIFIERDNNLLTGFGFYLRTFLNKITNNFTYPILFWIYMICYQINRTMYLILNKGLRSAIKQTLPRIKLIKKFL